MIRILAIIAMAGTLGACATAAPSFDKRPLSAAEKEALGKSLSQTLKDPEAARFKWLPVIIPQPTATAGEQIGYCGLVNGKNSFGGYIGYKRYYATLTHNLKGEYEQGVIQNIEGRPITLFGNETVDDAVATGLTEGNCRRWGYVDWSGAQ